MVDISIDESGSITCQYAKNHPYFVVALVMVKDKKNLKKALHRFISSNMKTLECLDKASGKMFLNGKFRELKGSVLDDDMMKKFIYFIAQNNYFEVYYLHFRNQSLRPCFCENIARAFNYVLRNAVEYYMRKGFWEKTEYRFQLDERNEKTRTRFFLEDYLNTELGLDGKLEQCRFHVQYFDSTCNALVQVADVFSNFYYRQLFKPQVYEMEMKYLFRYGYIKNIYYFPYYC